jgi:polysaccharide pyruvyl transferase WcaK-like protein
MVANPLSFPEPITVTDADSECRRVFILGAFDLDNYGDLLFPLIAAYRLAKCGIEVVPVAPTATLTAFADAMPQIDVPALLTGDEAAAGILIGGGWIIHNQPVENLDVYRQGNAGKWASAGFWLAGVLAGAIRDIPIVWNAPGVPNPFPLSKLRGVVEPAIDASDYVAVRERSSAGLLVTRDPERIRIVPDTAIDISAMWPHEQLRETFEVLAARQGFQAGGDYAALHLRRNLGQADMPAVAAEIDAFMAAHGLTPLILSISHAMNDAAMAENLSRQLRTPHILLSNPSALREIAACIACSRVYLGVSLHAYVTAAAYGVPGVIVAHSAHRRLSGFLEHTGRRRDLARDWREGLRAAGENLAEGSVARVPDAARQALDEHWQRVEAALADPHGGSSRRQRFLRTYMRYGIEREGAVWGLEPGITQGSRMAPRNC